MKRFVLTALFGLLLVALTLATHNNDNKNIHALKRNNNGENCGGGNFQHSTEQREDIGYVNNNRMPPRKQHHGPIIGHKPPQKENGDHNKRVKNPQEDIDIRQA